MGLEPRGNSSTGLGTAESALSRPRNDWLLPSLYGAFVSGRFPSAGPVKTGNRQWAACVDLVLADLEAARPGHRIEPTKSLFL